MKDEALWIFGAVFVGSLFGSLAFGFIEGVVTAIRNRRNRKP